MTKDEALKLALEALKYEPINKTSGEKDLKDQAITAIKEALAQPEQEPLACVGPWHDGRLTLIPRYSHQTFERDQPLYTTPPQRKPLTDEEIDRINLVCPPTQQGRTYRAFARAIEAAHGIKEQQ